VTALAIVPRETVQPLEGYILPILLDEIDIGPNVRVNVEAIDELAASIAAHGVLQPIKVRVAGDRWIVVWGQRRLMAALENLMGEIDPETAARLAQGEMAPDLALKAETVPTEEVEPYDDAAEERIDDILKELAGGD